MFNRNSILGSMPPVVKNLLIINILMYAITALTGNWMYENFALFYF